MFTGTIFFFSRSPVNSNMHVGVVVKNFSYFFQASGRTRSISREQMRCFKKVWAQFSNPKTGYLERPQFAAFFSVSLHKIKKNMVDN
jgi:hypothetical protein